MSPEDAERQEEDRAEEREREVAASMAEHHARNKWALAELVAAVYDEMLGGLVGGFTVTEWVALDGNWYVAESTAHPLDWRIAVSVSTEETRWKKWTRPRVDFALVEGWEP